MNLSEHILQSMEEFDKSYEYLEANQLDKMKSFLRDSQIKLLEKLAELLAIRDAYKMPYSDFDIDMELRNEEKTKKHIANQWYEKGMDDSFSSLQEIIKSEIEKIK